MNQPAVKELDFGDQQTLDASLSVAARGLQESGILKITRQVRAMIARGETVVNLTVGDFDPRYFPIPEKLARGIQDAVARGETNYPTPEGMLVLRQAISDYVARTAGVRYPVEAIVVCSGGRPVLYGAYRAIVNPGDKVLFSVPSWQNEAYSWLTGGESIVIESTRATGFQPTVDEFRPHLSEAAMLCICSPGNPTGTVMSEQQLGDILRAVVAENREREAKGRRPLFVLHDQMYGALVSKGQRHVYPAAVVPEAARYVISADGVSKAYAGTGLRLGWMLVAPAVGARIRDLLSNAGAWAPRPEQSAVAAFLADEAAIAEFRVQMDARLADRLNAMHEGFSALKKEGLPVDSINPQGAIYFSAQFRLHGKNVDGRSIKTDEDIRMLLLERAGVAVVPFQAFGVRGETGWFRLSAGAVSMDEIHEMFPRLRTLLGEV
ncbi:MAG TPA: aminotransferase class I/II-fold pyridoxal phosphate-dependent enzyme, partial [Gemmatimonadaceae bacterium]|nr:aminotransferase class I/II-fold pyridoxal phosphate-dependent enzyme [Gemmatimonadaceae bacterium]